MDLDYMLIYSNRKNITITIERDRTVVVRAPEGVSPGKVEAAVEAKKAWIFEKLRHPQKYNVNTNKKEFVSGETGLYLGRNYRLEIKNGGGENIRFAGKFVVTGVSQDKAGKLFREWYKQKAREKIVPRVKRHARNLGVEFNKVMISDLKYRWGSCTPNNNLNFSWQLIKAPMLVIDYVIVHELAHLLEHNHTPRFWNIVRTQVPGYVKARDWLRRHGGVLENNF